MVILRNHVHPRGLSLPMQKKVYVRRTVHKETFEKIAPQIKNLKGATPGWQVCRDAFHRMTKDARKDGYDNCGRGPTITPELRRWLVARLKVLRRDTVCTSGVLQRELASKKRVIVEESTVRRHLQEAGYKWLPRAKNKKYSLGERIVRKAFSDWILSFTPAELKRELHMSLDGVVLTIPPQGEIQRENFLKSDDLSVWRKPSERNLPELAGHDRYAKQVPKNRMLPLWGGISWGGFGMVLQHPLRKITAEDWKEAVDDGSFVAALRAANPGKVNGPWKVLCDNESFLRADASAAAHRRCNIQLIKMPPTSPDLNPVEKYWSWIRRRMKAMDLRDLAARPRRAAVGRMAYKARFLILIKTQTAKKVAGKTMVNLRKVALIVSKKGGHASGT